MQMVMPGTLPVDFVAKVPEGAIGAQIVDYYFFNASPPPSPRNDILTLAFYIPNLERLTATKRVANAKLRIEELAEAAREDNWDGEGASKLSASTKKVALRLVELISHDVVSDDLEIDATPFGSIDFEWVLDRDVMLNVIALSSGEIGYAYSVHGEQKSGKELWQGILPKAISEVFDKVFDRKGLDG